VVSFRILLSINLTHNLVSAEDRLVRLVQL
jgi:hypothetical protein